MEEIELVFNKNGLIVYRRTISLITRKENWVQDDQIAYDKLQSLPDGLNLTVTSIKPVMKDDILTELRFKTSNFKSAEEPQKNSLVSDFPDKIPPGIVKDLNEGIKAGVYPPHFVNFTRQLYQAGTEPYLIKKIIKENGSIGDRKLRELLKNEGYSPTSGGINATLNVLERLTKEIRVEGRGENKTYVWVAKNPLKL